MWAPSGGSHRLHNIYLYKMEDWINQFQSIAEENRSLSNLCFGVIDNNMLIWYLNLHGVIFWHWLTQLILR